jgi:Tol biopolymer transport system component
VFGSCVALALSACQGSPSPTASVTLPPASTNTRPTALLPALAYRAIALSGQFVFDPGGSSIWIQDAATFEARPLLKHNPDVYYESPSFSPDGAQVVFVAYSFDQGGGQVKEIRTIDTDGTDERTLFKAPSTGPRIFLSDPRYSPDGAWIYFSVSTIQDDLTRTQTYDIVRGPASGGDWHVILKNGDHPRLTSDGKRLAYLRFNPLRFSSSLWVANSDGSNPQQLLADDNFGGVIGQSFSPDGNWIVFSASGPPKKTLPGISLQLESPGDAAREAEDSCVFGIGSFCLVQRALADGLPWDLWLVSSDGKRFEQLTKLGLDSPWAAFSGDGRYIAFISTNGLFVYDRETKGISLLDTEMAHEVMDWFQK